ncbi:uncharacterized protein C19orf47-like [Ptychodera flava]|uniref:uncharacterized protein C19orf47-like n=1 Tax=Ptychodera flava TaxID=63121 RepID=UPI003969C751
MAASKEMSDWIKFFTGAGIPPGPASTYAVTFIDNRIKRGMLIDLTKEYLKDMGISVMGDIISILKHSKSVHAREEREKPALAALPASSDGMVEIKRQTTPGSRMLEHFLRKEGVNIEPEPKVKVTTEMATRLGAVPKTGSKAVLDVSQIKQVEVKPVKKPRKISPEPELEQKGDSKKSVFDRLGASGKGSVADNNGKKVMKKAKSDTQISGDDVKEDGDSSSVFKRLGGRKRQKTMSLSSDDGSVLEYVGVLKPGASPTKAKQQKVTSRWAVA